MANKGDSFLAAPDFEAIFSAVSCETTNVGIPDSVLSPNTSGTAVGEALGDGLGVGVGVDVGTGVGNLFTLPLVTRLVCCQLPELVFAHDCVLMHES